MTNFHPPGSPNRRREELRVHLKLIDDGVGPVLTKYREHIQCAPGCSDCCSQQFSVSELEAERLRDGLAELSDTERDDIGGRASTHAPGQPCPVLSSQGRCRLYEHRPRICRKYGIPLWDPGQPERVRTCPLNFRGVTDIDQSLIVDPQAMWAAEWIGLRQRLNLGPQDNRTIAEWLAIGSS
ncbi:MAG: YkgJ family cysteine cluster protein [Nannocystaceae bacterium]